MLLLIAVLLAAFRSGVTQFTDLEASHDNSLDPARFVFRNVCYTSLDDECFDNGPPFFHPTHRPFSPTPDEAKDVKFKLYTLNNPKRSSKLKSNKNSIQKSPFNCDLNTVVISHGYEPDYDAFVEMKDAVLNAGSFNVIINDWRKYADSPYYQAVANTRTVGARVAKLVKSITDACGSDGSKFYLVGHSLGAQVSGYAGKRLPDLQRITGLDPAGSYFEGTDKEVHLDASDADYVDIIHTNAADFVTRFGIGYLDPLGDIDFYANDGTNQPGCKVVDAIDLKKGINFTELSSKGSCSHSRANEIYTESVKSSDCKFVAVQCDSFEDFNNGLCPPKNKVNAVAGFPSQKVPGVPPYTSFYFRTNGSSPFCVQDSNKPGKKMSVLSRQPIVK